MDLAKLARKEIPNLDSLDHKPKNYLTGWAHLVGDKGIRSRFIKALEKAGVEMDDTQEASIKVSNGIISSIHIPLFKGWLGLEKTPQMTEQFEQALKDPQIAAGIAQKWTAYCAAAKQKSAGKVASNPESAEQIQQLASQFDSPAALQVATAQQPDSRQLLALRTSNGAERQA